MVRGAAELRLKETDRIAATVEGLSGLGADIEATDDGFVVHGGTGIEGGTIDARGDHRMAMLGAVAGLASRTGVEVVGMEAAAVSYPGFEDDVRALVSGPERRLSCSFAGPCRSFPPWSSPSTVPPGAGKSTVARELARALGFSYLDSGAMYRAVALSLDERPGAPAERARDVDIELGDQVLLDGRDVTRRDPGREVSEAASQIAADPGVRAALVAKQRELLKEGDWVGEGRDIGTVVAPDAELKIYLTASPEERARRRAVDLGGADWRVVMRDQALRDAQDTEREHSPLRAAPDSIELDSTDRPIEDVVRQIVGLVRDPRRNR